MNLKFLSWQEGKYSDLWIVVHFLSGVVGGSFLFLLNMPLWYAWVIAISVAVAWEVFELFFNLREDKTNKFFDIFLGLFGFVCTFIWLPKENLSIFSYEALTIVEILLLLMSSLGWRNYKKYGKRKGK